MSSKTPVKILGYFIRTMFLTPKKPMSYFCLSKSWDFLKSTEILGLHRMEILGLARVKILEYFIRASFFDAKNPWPTFACQNHGLFEECKDIRPTLYQNSRINTCRNLGVFLKNQVFDTKNTLSVWLVEILGFFFFKENRDFGHTLYENFRLNTHQNLGCLIRTMFLDAKNPWPILLVKVLGFLKRTEILGLHCIKMSSKTPVKILGYFIRTMFLTPKKPYPTFACQNLGTFKEYRDIGFTSYRNLRISTCQNLGVSEFGVKEPCFWRQKPMAKFCLSKSWAFWRVQRYLAYIELKFQD